VTAFAADATQPRGSSPAGLRTATATEAVRLRSLGINVVLEPSADVAYAAGPAASTGLADDPADAAALARAAAEGWSDGGLIAAPGHFPGQGSASQDPRDGPATVGLGRADLAAADLRVFRAALPHAGAVVVSSAAFAAYDAVTPAALVPAITRDLLRRRLRFDGVAISDEVESLGTSPGADAVDALRAGIDLVRVGDPANVDAVYRAVLSAAHSGRLPAARLRDAAAHVLALTARAALPAPSPG
jgi:beta-N-acetylhexosaminidase